MMVSARVVKTRSWLAAPSISYGKPKLTPVLRPIQFSCMARTCCGQPSSRRQALEQLVGVVRDPQV